VENLYLNTAKLYDADNRAVFSSDIPFYLDRAKKLGGKTLEEYGWYDGTPVNEGNEFIFVCSKASVHSPPLRGGLICFQWSLRFARGMI